MYMNAQQSTAKLLLSCKRIVLYVQTNGNNRVQRLFFLCCCPSIFCWICLITSPSNWMRIWMHLHTYTHTQNTAEIGNIYGNVQRQNEINPKLEQLPNIRKRQTNTKKNDYENNQTIYVRTEQLKIPFLHFFWIVRVCIHPSSPFFNDSVRVFSLVSGLHSLH